MRRIGFVIAAAILGSSIAGCDSGISEGTPKEGPMEPANDAFKAEMKKNAERMKMKGPPPAAPAGAPAAK